MTITRAQLTRLQTCVAQMGKRVAGFENTREARLQWATVALQREARPVTTFSDLSSDEAKKLIDRAQGEIGHRAPLKPAPTRRGTEHARRAGLDGRKDNAEFADAPQIVSAAQISEIASRYQRLGWGTPQYEAWLKGRTSPLRGRNTIRTFAEANKVLWALKGMLEDAGLWIDWSKP